MPQRKSQGTDDQDPGQLLQEESNQERREEEGGAPPPDRARGGRARQGDGRAPSPEPDVFMDVPKVQVEEIYLDVEGLDAHLSLRTKLGNLLQLVAGVHVTAARSSSTSRASMPRPCSRSGWRTSTTSWTAP